MTNAPHHRLPTDGRDWNPRTRQTRYLPQQLARARRAGLDAAGRGSVGGGELQTMVYVRPAGTDLHIVQSVTDPNFTTTVPSTMPGTTFTPGQRVLVGSTQFGLTILGHPPGAEKGVSRGPIESSDLTVEPFLLSSISPLSYNGSSTTAATVTGSGFRSDPLDVLEAVLYRPNDPGADADGYISDPDVTLTGLAFVSSSELSVSVAHSSVVERSLNLRITRG